MVSSPKSVSSNSNDDNKQQLWPKQLQAKFWQW
ncbi:hypothetical protein T4E_1645 [Trichinella pseudospiralis]|uniref:Uncharacterized protein n=1 Tax=Trichinella pseudospiralis TaxID=6337 RepID=A0A0V0W8L4_TRIPS|nr:hypothetical protein T4E_1645 [Trichinella pseudospiralis]